MFGENQLELISSPSSYLGYLTKFYNAIFRNQPFGHGCIRVDE